MKTKMIVLSVLVLLTFALRVAHAAPNVTAIYWQVEGGYRLAFTLTAAEKLVYGWALYRTDTVDIASPEGWWGWVVGIKYTRWDRHSGDFQPGQTLQGFAATLPELPSQIDYFILQSGPVTDTYYGTLVPTPIPEPSSLLAFAGGIAGFGGVVLKRRKRIK